MKAKLLQFVEMSNILTEHEKQVCITRFRERYPQFKLVSEFDEIDYSLYSVKCILIEANKQPFMKFNSNDYETIINVRLTNTKGNIYMTMGFNRKKSNV